MRHLSPLIKIAATTTMLVALTACLDLPIEGEVSGHSMSWITTSLNVDSYVVASSSDLARVNDGDFNLASQVLLSDLRTSCENIGALAEPGDGLHTLALNIGRPEGNEVEVGEYWIGGSDSESSIGTLEASFLTGAEDELLREDATAGVLVISYADGYNIDGEIHIDFVDGTLRGYFSSCACE